MSLFKITPGDLETWAKRIGSDADLPRLIRRLILASPVLIEDVDFQTDETTRQGGVDGTVRAGYFYRSFPCAFVPEGDSVWELTVQSSNLKDKVTRDFTKRTPDATITYVAVLARRWGGKTDWLEAHRETGWRGVKVWDADDLAAWLESCPSVAAWFARQIGKCPVDVTDLDGFAADWQARTPQRIPLRVLTATRLEEVDRVQAWARGAASDQPGEALTVAATAAEEALAFVCAALCEQRPNDPIGPEHFRARTLVVRDRGTWDALLTQHPRQGLILLPDFDQKRPGETRAHVLVSRTGAEADIVLRPIPPRDLAWALCKFAQLQPEDANSAAQASAGTMNGLLRALGAELEPDWYRALSAQDRVPLLPALLLGAWGDKRTRLDTRSPAELLDGILVMGETFDSDHEVVAALAGRSYEDYIQHVVHPLATHSEPPIRLMEGGQRHIDRWSWENRREAWRLLGGLLARPLLKAWGAQVDRVLADVAPRFGLPVEERWLCARQRDCVGKFSEHLHQGVIEGLNLLAAERGSLTGLFDLDGFLAERVRRALHGQCWNHWASLERHLGSLATLAPDAFFDALDASLSTADANLARLFDTDDYGRESGAHGVLAAIETGARTSAHSIPRALELLARLEPMEPMEPPPRHAHRGDRVERSMLSVLVHVPPTFQQDALGLVEKRQPELARQLRLRLLESTSRFVHAIQRAGIEQGAANETLRVHGRVLLTQALAGTVPWETLLKPQYGQTLLGLGLGEELTAALRVVGNRDLSADERLATAWPLRVLLHHLRDSVRYGADAEFIEQLHAPLLAVYRELEPSVEDQGVWWFQHGRIHDPETTSDTPFESDWDAIKPLRREAVRMRLTSPDAVERLSTLITRSGNPREIGAVLGRLLTDAQDEDFLSAEWPDEHRPALLRALASSCFWRRLEVDEASAWAWAQAQLEQTVETDPARFDALLLTLPLRPGTLAFIESLPTGWAEQYWAQPPLSFVPELELKETERLVSTLLAHSQAAKALHIVVGASTTEANLKDLPTSLLQEVLESVPGVAYNKDEGLGWAAKQVHKTLFEKENRDAGRLCAIEFQILPLFDFDSAPLELYRQMQLDPGVFMRLLRQCFSPEPDPDGQAQAPRAPTEEERRLATRAYQVLDRWLDWLATRPGSDLQPLWPQLERWVSKAERLAAETGHSEIAASKLGEVLARAPEGNDQVWPYEPVRALLEEERPHKSTMLVGLHVGLHNLRGMHSRSGVEGGVQERVLEKRYLDWADALEYRAPTVARVLREVSMDYAHEARQVDVNAAEVRRRQLFDTLEVREGHFTWQEVEDVDHLDTLRRLLDAGRVEEVLPGIFRMKDVPQTHEDEYLLALWMWSRFQGVISHDTALERWRLSSILPRRTHITLPEARQREGVTVPAGIVLHFADIPKADQTWDDAQRYPITTPARTILDCAAANVDPSIVQEAVDVGLERRLFTADQVAAAMKYLETFTRKAG